VRYAADIKEYIQAALSPAEISQIQLDYDDKKANVIVANDQLSLAIGRHGQNVRLASQLVEWELNLFSFDQWAELQEEIEAEEAGESAQSQVDEAALSSLSGIGKKLMTQLKEAELDTLEKIAKAEESQLTAIKGLGKVKAKKLIEEAQSLTQTPKD